MIKAQKNEEADSLLLRNGLWMHRQFRVPTIVIVLGDLLV